MTINDFIATYKSYAKDYRKETYNMGYSTQQRDYARDKAREYEQLAEWLEELKELRSQKSNWLSGYDTSRDLFYYNKALEDAIAECRKTSGEYIDTFSDYLCAGLHMAVRIAEKLKAGAENDD